MILGLLAAVFLVSATLFLFSSYVLVSLLEFCAGLGGGAVYMIVFDRVLEEKFLEPGINREFCLQVVGAGETAGTMVGGLLGTMLKATLCSWLTGAAERWCQTSR
jgi:battenin